MGSTQSTPAVYDYPAILPFSDKRIEKDYIDVRSNPDNNSLVVSLLREAFEENGKGRTVWRLQPELLFEVECQMNDYLLNLGDIFSRREFFYLHLNKTSNENQVRVRLYKRRFENGWYGEFILQSATMCRLNGAPVEVKKL